MGVCCLRILVLSDTHDLLRSEVLEQAEACDCILHAGDFASAGILERLKEMKPVHAVRGNADGAWAGSLPQTLSLTLEGVRICMAHKKKDLPDPKAHDLAISGHTHSYTQTSESSTVFLNPGSCGPRRLYLPVTVALLDLNSGSFEITRINLQQAQEAPKSAGNLYDQIAAVVRETERGHSVSNIARRLQLDPALVEQIVRLYVTHPGVTVDGILTKMGLLGL